MGRKIKIYDCLLFFNEVELLEIRLKELSDYVDYFVIAEAKQTYRGDSKPLNYLKSEKRFKKWAKKIIYIPIDLPKLGIIDKAIIKLMDCKYLPRLGTNSLGLNFIASLFGIGRWKFVYKQREGLIRGIKNAQDKDVIMLSDLDEIPNTEKIVKMKKFLKKYDYVLFEHRPFFYYLNGLARGEKWIGTAVCTFKTLRTKLHNKIQFIRTGSIKERLKIIFGFKRNVKVIKNAGWHFSSIGGFEKLKIKTKVVAESTALDMSDEALKQDVREGIFRTGEDSFIKIDYIKLDSNFPKTIKKGRKQYSHLIKKA